MVNKHGYIKRKICTEKMHKYFSNHLSIVLNNHGRHSLLSFLSPLPISVLRNLEFEANKLYDRANKLCKTVLFTRCYVKQFLVLILILRSTINDILSKFHLSTKVWSICKDKSVIFSVPNYLK